MGTSLSKEDSGDGYEYYLGSAASYQQQEKNKDLMLQWRAWMASAEGLYIQGKLKACREALTKDTGKPALPEGALDAALLRVTARANASICRLAEISLRTDRAGGDGGRGGVGRSKPSTEDTTAESRQAAVADLEDAMREAIAIAAAAAAAASASAAAAARVSSSDPLPPTAAANVPANKSGQSYPDATRDSSIAGGIGNSSRKIRSAGDVEPMLPWEVVPPPLSSPSSLRSAVIASAAEDVAVQVACSVLASRLAWGEASKALSSGLYLLASRRSNIAAAAAAAAGNPKEVGSDRGGGERDESLRREEKEKVATAAVTDAFFGVDLLREAFESALTSGNGERRRLPLQEAAPRLVHLVRLTWLLATANLALGRNPAAAASIIAVAEHAYCARRSAWRKASLILLNSLPGASGVPSPPLHVPSDQMSTFGGLSWRAEYGVLGVDGRPRGGMGGGGGRDPALAMCRYLRGLSSLGCGDGKAAREQLEACIELDPRIRHAIVCLAHLSCHASAATKPGSRCIHPHSRWEPDDDERTHELLRVLAQGCSALSDARERGMVSPTGGGTAGGVLEGGAYQGGHWRAFEEERGGGVEAWLLLACVARAGGDCGGAVSKFRRALVIDPNCLEAVYGIARVLQESGNDPAGCRNLLLFVGERSQELSSAAASTSTTTSASDAPSNGGPRSSSSSASAAGDLGDRRHRRREAARLCFPLCGEASENGGGNESVAGNLVLPAGLAEVMWRVARASMSAQDWATAILALRGLMADRTGGDLRRRVYFASYSGDGGTQISVAGRGSPGPGRARVLRALAYCQLRRGLFREALETTKAVLSEGDGSGTGGGDAAMLMFRADALLCLEEGEEVAMDSLEKATRLLDLRQIDMSFVPPPHFAWDKPGVAATCGGESDEVSRQSSSGVAAFFSPRRARPSTTDSLGVTVNEAANVSRRHSVSSPLENAATATECSAAEPHERHRRIARIVAYNNRALLLIAAGRYVEACRLLRACLSLLPGEPRPAFNLALALWRLGRPREACSHWLESRGWLKAGDSGDGVEVDRFSRLLEAARRRKALLESDTEKRRTAGSGRGNVAAVTSHIVDGIGDHLTVPPIQLCLLDIRTLSWWMDNLAVGRNEAPSVSTAVPSGDISARGSGGGGLLRSVLTSR